MFRVFRENNRTAPRHAKTATMNKPHCVIAVIHIYTYYVCVIYIDMSTNILARAIAAIPTIFILNTVRM